MRTLAKSCKWTYRADTLFHGDNTGSNPVGDANIINSLTFYFPSDGTSLGPGKRPSAYSLHFNSAAPPFLLVCHFVHAYRVQNSSRIIGQTSYWDKRSSRPELRTLPKNSQFKGFQKTVKLANAVSPESTMERWLRIDSHFSV